MNKTSYKNVTVERVRGYCSPKAGPTVYLDLKTAARDSVELCLSEAEARKMLGRMLTGLRRVKRQKVWANSYRENVAIDFRAEADRAVRVGC